MVVGVKAIVVNGYGLLVVRLALARHALHYGLERRAVGRLVAQHLHVPQRLGRRPLPAMGSRRRHSHSQPRSPHRFSPALTLPGNGVYSQPTGLSNRPMDTDPHGQTRTIGSVRVCPCQSVCLVRRCCKESRMPAVPATRRQFLRRAAASSAALAVPHVITSSALGGPTAAPPSDRVRVGFIGTGGHGIGQNLNGFLRQRDAAVAALCDVDDGCLARGVKVAEDAYKARGLADELTSIFKTKDWRQVIERPEVDAVMVSAPDHWHCLMSIWAIRAGKDVICEKPTYDIAQGRALADTVRRYAAVFATATEDRSIAVYHRLAEVVRNRLIGKLVRIELTLPQAPGGPGDPTPQPVPPGLDWDMWLGPAAWAPYCPGRVHFNFRYCSNTGAGILADWGCHQVDTAQWANDTERSGPVEVEGVGKRFETGLYDTIHTYDITY
ncbi:MAG: Gfo/Idh/MocA family oxidoreductase, partial [Planctomycetes bacterium]|nr:Gfo/Idh/MocA family oxidoreductase [Planctomycetota bacterium]